MYHQCNKFRREFIALVLAGSMFAVTAPGDATAQSAAFRLDHFQCYDVFGPASAAAPSPELVTLEDQFDASVGILEEGDVGDVMRWFCNPTQKRLRGTLSTILNKDHHLAFYRFKALDTGEIFGVVKIFNQFGDQALELRSADILAVPTQKLEPIFHDPPIRLNHFKCYFAKEVKAAGKGLVKVGLEDQFSAFETKHKVGDPLLFCNPVKKTVLSSGAGSPIVNPDAHLTCYEFQPPKTPLLPSGAIVTEVFLANQFTEGSPWKIGTGNLLCVPTEKVDFKVTFAN